MTSTKKTNGILLFAKNNKDFNYIKQAQVSAMLAKHYLNVPVAIVTSVDECSEDLSMFDVVIDWKAKVEEINLRPMYVDGKFKPVQWHNLDRLTAYELSPFDETILIDTDYLIQNDVLNTVWGNIEPMLMNTHTRIPAKHQQHVYELVVQDGFSKVHWFTVMYFRKCQTTEDWFNVAKYVRENYDFYKNTFRIPYQYFRNDITAAIASHLIGGFRDDYIKPLPIRQINSFNMEKILQVKKDSILIETETIPALMKNTNVHMLNKQSIEEHYDTFMEIYS
tara:strand:- start:19427 stop:20263 length:837 start_codon:yes stop_codon:yes gene_type:complete